MKIYFAGSIRGGRDYQEFYADIIKQLSEYGEVLTEHIGSEELSSQGEAGYTDRQIFNRDIAWIEEADVIVAEVTSPSLGVGYELGKSECLGKKVLCLFNARNESPLSAMIAGNDNFQVKSYRKMSDVKQILESFFS